VTSPVTVAARHSASVRLLHNEFPASRIALVPEELTVAPPALGADLIDRSCTGLAHALLK
jgi:hypothetical protein